MSSTSAPATRARRPGGIPAAHGLRRLGVDSSMLVASRKGFDPYVKPSPDRKNRYPTEPSARRPDREGYRQVSEPPGGPRPVQRRPHASTALSSPQPPAGDVDQPALGGRVRRLRRILPASRRTSGTARLAAGGHERLNGRMPLRRGARANSRCSAGRAPSSARPTPTICRARSGSASGRPARLPDDRLHLRRHEPVDRRRGTRSSLMGRFPITRHSQRPGHGRFRPARPPSSRATASASRPDAKIVLFAADSADDSGQGVRVPRRGRAGDRRRRRTCWLVSVGGGDPKLERRSSTAPRAASRTTACSPPSTAPPTCT